MTSWEEAFNNREEEDQGEGEEFFIPIDAALDLGLIQENKPPLSDTGLVIPGQSDTGSWEDAFRSRSGSPGALGAPSIIRGVYSPVPLSELRMQQQSYRLLSSMEFGEDVNPFLKNDILNKVSAMEQTPVVAHILANNKIIDDWQSAVWPYVLDGMINGASDQNTHLGIFDPADLDEDRQTQEFLRIYGDYFSPEEKEFLMQVIAAVPSGDEMLFQAEAEGRFTVHRPENDSVLSRAWAGLRTATSLAFNAPDVLSAQVGSPRGNVVTQAALWLQDKPADSIAGKSEFFNFLIGSANRQNENLDRLTGGFEKFAQRTVGAPVMLTKNVLKELALNPEYFGDSPENYLWREGLTVAQNVAVDIGLSPNDSAWSNVTGAMDAMVEWGFDPITMLSGMGAGARATKNVMRPAGVSRLQALGSVLRPGAASRLGFDVFDRGVIPRIWWSAFSRQVDEFTNTSKAVRNFKWIAENGSTPGTILRRYPQLRNIPTEELERLVGANTVEQARDVWRGWLTAAPSGLEETPKIKAHRLNQLLSTRDTYRAARDAVLESGEANIRGMNATFDGVYDDEVFELASGAVETGSGVYRRAEFSGSGAPRTVVSAVGRGPLEYSDLSDPIILEDVSRWLTLPEQASDEATELAAWLTHGVPLADLTEPQVELLRGYLQAAGKDAFQVDDAVVFGRNVDEMLYHGLDDEVALAPSAVRATEASAMRQADLDMLKLRQNVDTNAYFVIDTPKRTLTSKLQDSMRVSGRLTPNKFLAGLRRTGFRLGHALPSNIELTHGAKGSISLRNWIKALGGGDALATKWMDEFIAATSTTRLQVVKDAMRDVGETIDNVQLREGLVQFFNKQGQQTFALGRDGADIGLTRQGSVLPMTITHLTNEVVMPDAKTLLRSVRRFKQARGPTPVMRAGWLKGTRDRRVAIVNRLKSTMRARGMNPSDLTDEEWLAVGYADVLSQITDRSKADALGAVNTMGRFAATPYKMLHHAFVIGQLAFRPLAWSGRVLLEETIRADLVGMPSLWSNPYQFMKNIADASAISKLSDDLQGQAKVVEGLMASKFFPATQPNWTAIKKVFPDIDSMLDEAGIARSSTGRVRAFVASRLGQNLVGGEAVTSSRIGSRLNWGYRSFLRNRRVRRAHRILDETGLLRDFRWQSDALDITNRSLWQEFIKESSSSFADLEYRAGQMTPEALDAYGRGWGRSVFQMFGDDPLVRRYGLERYRAALNGRTPNRTTAALLSDPDWERIRPLVQRKLTEDGITLDAAGEAQWYLDNVVDEITHTLIDPLAHNGSTLDMAKADEIADALLNRKTISLEFGDGIEHSINFSRDNYEGVVSSFVGIAHSRNSLNLPAPKTVTGMIDPRFGQRSDDIGFFRRFSDWALQKFGEGATQTLNRRPAYLVLHKRYYDYARTMGADAATARAVADEKAAETVNYVFFNNQDIPELLKDMNKVIPFFSAMWEVGQTWLYKIPAHQGWPIGATTLLRKVDRTFDALFNAGIIEMDEDGQYFMRGDPDGSLFSKGLFYTMRAPFWFAESMVGIGRMLLDQVDADGVGIEPWRPADLSAWSKDGFTLGIGNPLDLTSHGIMAVNNWSIGPTPTIAYPLGRLTERMAAVDRKLQDTGGLSLGQFAEQNDEVELSEVLYINRDAFEEKNGKEAVARAFAGDADITQLEMPDFIQVPRSSWWESLVDTAVFPFGVMDSPGQIITSASPAALNHVWRGMMAGTGNSDSAAMNFLFGRFTQYQMSSEVIYALQSMEAEEGLASELMDLAVERQKIIEGSSIEAITDENGLQRLKDDGSPEAARLQEIQEEIRRKEETYLSRAFNNAMGSMLLRGLTGSFLPATPRMFDWQQEEASAYWDQRNFAEEARIRGSANFADLLKTLPKPDGNSFLQAREVVKAFMDDPSGMEARVWVRDNHPALEPFLRGKSYWDGGVPPPESLEFDQWIEDIQQGKRKPFEPEVWVARQQRGGISVDREIAILNEYGNNPDQAAQAILMDQDKYRELTEPFDMEFEAADFLDSFVYEGRYKAWRDATQSDNLSLLSETTDKIRFYIDAIDTTQDLLEYGRLDADEQRQIRGMLTATQAELGDAYEVLRDNGTDEKPWIGPRDTVLSRYWDNVGDPYYSEKSRIFDEIIDQATTSLERSVGFNELRNFENQHWLEPHNIEGWQGGPVQVPSEQLRAWNGRTPKEKQDRILNMLDKKPEWLNLFQTFVLTEASPQLERVLPTTPEDWDKYDETAEQVAQLKQFHTQNPLEFTESQLERAVAELEDERDKWLIENGRGSEVAWRELYVPAQKLDYAELLPQSLKGVMPTLNSLLEALRAEEHSPTSNAGEQAFLLFREWLLGDYFYQNSTASSDMDSLGMAMFGESVQSAVLARLFQGDRFGYLE